MPLKQYTTNSKRRTTYILPVFWLQATTPLQKPKTSSLESASTSSHLWSSLDVQFWQQKSPTRHHYFLQKRLFLCHPRPRQVSSDVGEERPRSTWEGWCLVTGCHHPLRALQLESWASAWQEECWGKRVAGGGCVNESGNILVLIMTSSTQNKTQHLLCGEQSAAKLT